MTISPDDPQRATALSPRLPADPLHGRAPGFAVFREIDHGMRGGAGIMLDDVVAGILAAIILLLVRQAT